MLAEFIDRIAALATKAAGVSCERHIDFPRKMFISGADIDGVQRVDIPAPLRRPTLIGLDDLVQFIGEADAPEVYVGKCEIRILWDKADRLEFAACPLITGEAFDFVASLELAKSPMTQAAAIRALRFHFPGAHAEAIIRALRKVDFSRTSTGARTVEHGRESFGRAVEAEVQQRAEIPETFSVEVPCFVNPGLQFAARVIVGLEIDVDSQVVRFAPLADEINRAYLAVGRKIIGALADVCAESDAIVYAGHPGL